MLSFVGCGSAFNTELGNNAAFIKEGNILFLIDCGSSTFSRIQTIGLLKDVEQVVVLVTHTHPDHIGSLGDLIFYCYYAVGRVAEPSVHLFVPDGLQVRHLLNMMGVKENKYRLIPFTDKASFHHRNVCFQFEAVEVNHVEYLKSYGYIIHYENKTIYYSGDCKEIPEPILDKLHKKEFDQFYQDTCKADYEGNPHLSLKKLEKLIQPHVRNRVFCMHLDQDFSFEEAENLGFNVVHPINFPNPR